MTLLAKEIRLLLHVYISLRTIVWARAGLRLLYSLAIFLICVSSATADQSSLTGLWTGNYSCGGTDRSDLTLDIEEHDGIGMLRGILKFESPDGSGSYNVAGRLRADGQLTLVPQGWIERPAGFTALGTEAVLSANGRHMEGRMTPCLSGAFSVSRDEARRAMGEATSEPLSGGDFAGIWRGQVECRANRRGNVELLPLEATLWQDGSGVGGIAALRIWRQRNSGGGEYWDQTALLTGSITGAEVSLQAIVVDDGGAPYPLNRLSGTLQSDGSLSGEARLRSCESFTMRREAELPVRSSSTPLEGTWTGTGDRNGGTLVTLQPIAGPDPDFWLLEAIEPISRPEAERDRLRLVLMEVDRKNGATVLVPVNAREATGPFRRDSRPRVHALTASGVFVLRPDGASGLSLQGITDGPNSNRELAAALAGDRPVSRAGAELRQYLLARPAGETAIAMEAGELPPLDMGPGIGGLLAAAPSREEQCRILDRWLAPFTAGHDMQRVESEEGRRLVADAFVDAEFVPVFGLPFLLTSPAERAPLRRLIRETCTRDMGFEHLAFVGNLVLPDSYFQRIAAMFADRAETALWRDGLAGELAALSPDDDGLARIVALRNDLRARQRDMTRTEQTELAALIDRREAELQAGVLLAQAEALPEDGFDSGALDRVFALMSRTEMSGLDRALLLPARQVAEARAEAILGPVLREIGAAALQQPQTLDGLAAIMADWNRLAPARQGMQRHFGYFDGEGHLAGLELRQQQLWGDPVIIAAFRTHLASVQTGPIAQPVLENEAARYFDLERGHLAPGWSEALSEAVALAELGAVRVTLLAASMPEGAPTEQDIALFAFNRVKNVNASLDEAARRCAAGQYRDAAEAMYCAMVLMTPNVRASLQEVRVAGCVAEVEMQQYLCTFSQRVDMGGAGGGGGWWVDAVADLTASEAVDGRFIRAAQGGWTVITGDLR